MGTPAPVARRWLRRPRAAIGQSTRPVDAAGDGDGTGGADDAAVHVHVAAVSFAEKPNDKVRAFMKSVGLVWSGTEQRWRPKAAGTAAITAAQAADIRAAGGVIAAG
ncbi:MAG: hypothetical protein ICV73_19065 [Acetobacteraceae bacterium]|nr:hypothetical protein [Acetobacteraceae bacterium]